jgi:hypothetical protein
MAITDSDMLADVQAIADGLPEAVKKTVVLYNRTSGDTYDGGTEYIAYRLPLIMADWSGLNRKTARWIMLGTTGQTELPKRGSKIVFNGSVFHVTNVERAFGDLWHRCDCFEEV